MNRVDFSKLTFETAFVSVGIQTSNSIHEIADILAFVVCK
ncbi:hypothetical protein CEV32_1455 [Brucella rhizosphaerae]|uniref:Uncharacterized protein n=1 Tax=Brucella rhizosphaerae TaxID=571254 RepID=A0A256F8E7_9HYPH|nr:hypothetical protein CEV32_1455 [Brucella rhizosphaerae]